MRNDDIARSRAQCMTCFDIIESSHRHDFVRCECGNIFLDGGVDYVRYGAPELSKEYINLLTEYKQPEQTKPTRRIKS